jgi:hypothetical protein
MALELIVNGGHMAIKFQENQEFVGKKRINTHYKYSSNRRHMSPRYYISRHIKLIECLPSEHWDRRNDPEWMIDYIDNNGQTYDVDVLSEYMISRFFNNLLAN